MMLVVKLFYSVVILCCLTAGLYVMTNEKSRLSQALKTAAFILFTILFFVIFTFGVVVPFIWLLGRQ